jgi:MGT family glycosyltransferase
MARFAFIVPPLVGHVNPTVSVANVLASRGHEVLWIGHEKIRSLLPDGATLHALDAGGGAGDSWFTPAMDRSRKVRGLESLQLLWQDLLVPLARAMMPGVEAAIAERRPDVLIVDQQAIAGALIARRTGARWASFVTTSAGVTDPLADLPKVKAWVDAQLAGLETAAGLPNVPGGELSPSRVIVFSTDALVGSVDRFAPRFSFVGPSIQARTDPTPFPFDLLAGDRKRVLVSLGTVSADRGDGFYDTVARAFRDDPSVQIILVAPDGALTENADHMIVRPRVPQLALLPKLDAVVSHGGHNTVCETLSHGLPLVVTPIRDDQPVVARQVVDAGAGVRLRYGRLPPKTLSDAVHQVLEDPRFREAAGRVRASFAAAGGASRAATLLEELAT